MATLPDGTKLPGRLFIVEGIDGSGKSTQLDLLHKWLTSLGYSVAFSEWNSSPVVRKTTKVGKKKQLLTPTSFSLIHAVDFADRYQQQIEPALKAGAIVLADRYIFTAFARDVARGVNRIGYVRCIPSPRSRLWRSTFACARRVAAPDHQWSSQSQVLRGRPRSWPLGRPAGELPYLSGAHLAGV